MAAMPLFCAAYESPTLRIGIRRALLFKRIRHKRAADGPQPRTAAAA